MAHDFSIQKKGDMKEFTYRRKLENGDWEEVTDMIPDISYFFGYANGLMYQAFGHVECNRGISGNGKKIEITHQKMMSGIEKAMFLFNRMNFSDNERLDSVKEFYNNHKDDPKDTIYIIAYH